MTVSLSRKRNLFIRVELREDDTDIRGQPLEVNVSLLVFPYVTLKFLRDNSVTLAVQYSHYFCLCN